MLFPDIVFIDTSLFREENFFALGNRIYTLEKLAKEGKIRLVTTEITIQEVKSNIKSRVREAWNAFDKDCVVFRNHPEFDTWRKTTDKKKEVAFALDLVDSFITNSKSKVLDYTYCSNAEKVFADYFEKRKPFGEGKKKDEFPDAFVLTSLENYAVEVHEKIIVLSKDSDMADYESKQLCHVDYRQYISDKVTEGVALDGVARKLCSDKIFLEPKIQQAVEEYLDDFRLYTTLLNLMEVSYHSIEDVNVEINEYDYGVLSVNGTEVEIEIQPEVSFKINVDYVNYDYATYDHEDGVWYNTEEETYEVDSEATIRVTLKYHLDAENGIEDLDIQEMDLTPLSDAIK